LDFWPLKAGPRIQKTTGMDIYDAVSWSSPTGPCATVRYEMLRQGFQLAEARIDILDKARALPEPERQACYDLIDRYIRYSSLQYLSQGETAYDWPAYSAEQFALAARLAGKKDETDWSRPPR
jgi:hypothetical protein